LMSGSGRTGNAKTLNSGQSSAGLTTSAREFRNGLKMIQRLSERGYRLVNVILTLAGLYAAYAGLLFFMQRAMIFPRGMIPVAAGLSLPKDVDPGP